MEGRKNIVEQVRSFVEEECRKPTSKYGYAPFPTHFVPVVAYAKILAEKMNADFEIVELAAWLHDIGSIMVGRENHHITGAEIAEKKLKEFAYEPKKIELIKQCILAHRGSKPLERGSLEGKIICDADGLAAFDRIEGLFMAALVYEHLGQEQARISVRTKLFNSYKKLSSEAKEIIKPKYEAAMLLLGEK